VLAARLLLEDDESSRQGWCAQEDTSAGSEHRAANLDLAIR